MGPFPKTGDEGALSAGPTTAHAPKATKTKTHKTVFIPLFLSKYIISSINNFQYFININYILTMLRNNLIRHKNKIM